MRNFKEIYRDLEQYTNLQKKAIGHREMSMVSGTVQNIYGDSTITVALLESETTELVFCEFDKSYEPILLKLCKGQHIMVSGIVCWDTHYRAKDCNLVQEITESREMSSLRKLS